MAFVTGVLLFAFIQLGAVDATMLESKETFTSKSVMEDERMVAKHFLDAESLHQTQATVASNLVAFKMRADQANTAQDLTTEQKLKVLQMQLQKHQKEFGTLPTEKKHTVQAFSDHWQAQMARHGKTLSDYLPEVNKDTKPVFVASEEDPHLSIMPHLNNAVNHFLGDYSSQQDHLHAYPDNEVDGASSGVSLASAWSEHNKRARQHGDYDVALQQMNNRVTEHQKPRKEMAKQQKKQGLLRKKAPPVVRDDKWKRIMRDTHSSDRHQMEHRMLRRLAFNAEQR